MATSILPSNSPTSQIDQATVETQPIHGGDDVIEKLLKDLTPAATWNYQHSAYYIDKSAGWSTRSALKKLRYTLIEYREFKDKTATDDFEQLISLHEYPPLLIRCWRDPCLQPSPCSCPESYFALERAATFSDCATSLSATLKQRVPGGLQVIATALQPLHDDTKGLSSFWRLSAATFRRRLEDVPTTPGHCLSLLIAHEYGILRRPYIGLVRLIRARQIDGLVLPSLKPACGNLDPCSQLENRFSLSWRCRAPIHKNDVEIYVWQRYHRPALGRYVDVVLIPEELSAQQSFRIFATFRRVDSLRLFRQQRTNSAIYKASSDQKESWTPASEAVFTFICIFEVMIIESFQFLKECSQQIQSMEYKGRKYPSATKIRYLIHLNDSRVFAAEGTKHALQVCASLSLWIESQRSKQPLWNAGIPITNRVAVIKGDLEYTQEELAKVGRDIQDLRHMIREQLDLTQGRRNLLLTLVAAAYLPLSFVTSLLGMNMNSTTPSDETGFSDFVNSTLASLPNDLQNSTSALISTIGTSGTLTWKWWQFGAIAGSLLITLPLSLVSGAMFRWLWRSAATYVSQWRLLVIVLAWPVVYYSIYFPLFYTGTYISVGVNSAVAGMIIAWTLARDLGRPISSFKKHEGQAKISRHMVITASGFVACGVINNYFFTNFPLVVVPWLYLSLRWTLPWAKQRQDTWLGVWFYKGFKWLLV